MKSLTLLFTFTSVLAVAQTTEKQEPDFNIQALVSNSFYNIHTVEGRTSSGPRISSGLLVNFGAEHIKVHFAYYYTQDKFWMRDDNTTLTGPKSISLSISDFAAGMGYTVFPKKTEKRYSIEFFGGAMITFVLKNKPYFNTSYTGKNPFNGHRDSVHNGESLYLGIGSAFRLSEHWGLKLNAMHRFVPFHIVEGFRNPLVNIQVGICYGVM
jgi:hypothetical protein